MADLNTQTEEALGWAAEGKKLAVDTPQVSLRDAVTFVAEMTPIVGDALAAKEVYDELQKDEPNYYLAGALGGAALVGLVPGLGDVAAKAIKKGAREVFDVAKRVEVDPNAMGSGLGNVRLKPKDLSDIDKAAEILDNPDSLKSWQQSNKIPENKRQANKQKAKEAAEDLYQGSITSKEARRIIDEELPITPKYTAETMPEMPSVTDVAGSLGKKVQKTGVVGVKGFDIPAGTRVGSRLDIPAYNNYDKWVVSIHDGKNDVKGSVLGYGQAVRLKNIKFGSESQDALDIARGKGRLRGDKVGTDTPEKPMGKATIARVYGDYVPEDPYELQEQARALLSDPEWTQIGMNPYRQSNFYDKDTGFPVFEAEEVIQVGPLVLAKGVKKPTKTQLKELAVRTKDGKLRLFNEGGDVMKNQMEMSFMEEGGIADDGLKRDPVSGNEIPPGSMASEVRDDIPAQLSEGEYVVPADVLRYYGVRFFEDLRSEAKQGMSQMEADGRIGGEPVPAGGPQEGELTPEDMAALEAMGLNVGGFIPQQPAPQARGNTMDSMSRAYQGGGLEDGSSLTTPTFTSQSLQQQFPLGFSIFGTNNQQNTGGSPQVKTVTLYGPDGTMRTLTLPTEQAEYDRLISEGYTLKNSNSLTTETSVGQNDDGGGSGPVDTQKPGKPYGEMDGTELQQAFSDNERARSVLTAMGLINPVFAVVGRGATNMAEKQILEAMEKKGVKPPVSTEEGGILTNIFDTVKSFFGGGKEKETTSTSGGTEAAVSKSLRPKLRTTTVTSAADNNDDDGGFPVTTAQSTAQTQAIMDSQETAEAKADTTKNLERTTAKVADIESGKNTSGQVGFKEGGLMSKGKKKSKNKK